MNPENMYRALLSRIASSVRDDAWGLLGSILAALGVGVVIGSLVLAYVGSGI